ncbi:MAG: phosphoribosylamine--glycine ligase [Candidatus Omnitrophica bacterium]|nr:phosphoribosylamine--glycine ligase [Candidatus Omnitrophota bacterium]
MKVLVVGSGGREHVLTWKIKQSSLVDEIFCAPGNGGMSMIAECVDIKVDDINGLAAFALEKKIDLTVVGPEAPLVEGIVDVFEKAGLKIFGPGKMASQLEGSKVFTKEFLKKHNIPTAGYRSFSDINTAIDFLKEINYPVVVKADGLAAGKGVIICENAAQAREALDQIMLQKVFKDAGNRVVIEEFLRGEEASILAISDGEDYVILASSQDHKRIFDEDQGPNTGGMGAYSPAPVVTPGIMCRIENEIIAPTIKGMKEDGCPFKGVLYAGLMIDNGRPKVLEYNVRFGDPETQVVIPRLKNDLVEIMRASCEGRLKDMPLDWDERIFICVVMSSGGYPGAYEKGKTIEGLDGVSAREGIVFHAGTKKDGDAVLTSGGRVLGVTGFGVDIAEAIDNVYKVVEKISFDRCFFRRDIGAKALKRVNETQNTSASAGN